MFVETNPLLFVETNPLLFVETAYFVCGRNRATIVHPKRRIHLAEAELTQRLLLLRRQSVVSLDVPLGELVQDVRDHVVVQSDGELQMAGILEFHVARALSQNRKQLRVVSEHLR